ncbi:MAG: vitamin K epoxide reductase family protein [Ignavibacterium sp.]|jgi:uncharacterized membrane protein
MDLPLLVLSLIGLQIALYFTLVHHKFLRPDADWLPEVCRMDERSCGSILATPEARVLKVPNYYLGMMYYVILIVLSFFPLGIEEFLLELRLISGFTMFLAVVLSYSLIWKLRVLCILCFASHTINLLIFLLLMVRP